MKVKKVNLEWYVLRWDSNTKKVIDYNILAWIKEDLAKEVRKGSVYNKSILREYLKTTFMYYYWSKTECEMLVSDLHKYCECEKIDIWRQIYPNLDRIVDYVNTQMDLKFE